MKTGNNQSMSMFSQSGYGLENVSKNGAYNNYSRVSNKGLNKVTHTLNKILTAHGMHEIECIYPIEIQFLTHHMMVLEESPYRCCCYLKFLSNDSKEILTVKEYDHCEILYKAMFNLLLGDEIFKSDIKYPFQIEKLLENYVSKNKGHSLFHIIISLNTNNIQGSLITLNFLEDNIYISGDLFNMIDKLRSEKMENTLEDTLNINNTSLPIPNKSIPSPKNVINNPIDTVNTNKSTFSTVYSLYTNVIEDDHLLLKDKSVFLGLKLTIIDLITSIKQKGL